jgi:site-specific DNA-methyltransferase (adenine-specific)
MELMKEFEDNYFDLAIVDPPYGIDLSNMNMGAGKSPKSSKIENRKWSPKDWDKVLPSDAYFLELNRVSKNQIIWGGNYFNLGPCKHFVIWDKEIPNGLSFSDCEFAWTSFTGAQKIFRYSAYKNKSEKIHPTQKPPQLYKWLLNNYAKEGDKILDTHLGSGSIVIACHYLGYDLTGCELDKDYFEAMQKRIKEETAQQDLF